MGKDHSSATGALKLSKRNNTSQNILGFIGLHRYSLQFRSLIWSKISFLSSFGPKRAIFYVFGGRIWTHGVIWSPLCVTTLLVYYYPKVITIVSMTAGKKTHCKRHDGPKALSTLTHITHLVQSSSFNKL